jgi:hypothetical protein
MELADSLQCSQGPITESCLEPVQFSPFPSGFPNNILWPMHSSSAPCVLHDIRPHFSFYIATLILFRHEHEAPVISSYLNL